MLGQFMALDIEPLAAQKLFSIGPLSVSNAMFFGVITAAFTVILMLAAAKATQLYPKSRFTYYAELLVEGIWGSIEGAFDDKKEAFKHLPLLGSLFILILVGNLTGSGMLPGVGTINTHGSNVLLRPFTTDLNATLSMAVLTIGLVQYYSIRKLGFKRYFGHYFAAPLWNPMNLFIGINEVFGEFLKIVTLAMRLFGVIYAGEVLISAVGQIAGDFGWLAMIPTVLLEIFFSLVQAYVFMMLSATYLAIRLSDGEHGESNNKGQQQLQAAK